MFTALAIATDYAMLPLANIKLMDSIVFVSALAFGLGVGVSVGTLTWLVYGSVNPLGSSGGLLLVILIVSENDLCVPWILRSKNSQLRRGHRTCQKFALGVP